MKKLIPTIALLMITAFVFAGPNSKANVYAERNVSISIKSQIRFPDFLKEREGEHNAAIFFKVTDCGTIAVQEIKCDDEELRQNLLGQVDKIKISPYGLDTKDTYKVVVRFQTL
jgi:hypothetical protein